jgi:hypothetical protein
LSDSLPIQNGLKQGDALLPPLSKLVKNDYLFELQMGFYKVAVAYQIHVTQD